MDYKEKYETALESIQEILNSGQDSIKMSRLQLRLQGIFPELKESEDERIRRVFRGWIYTRPVTFFDGISKEKMLAWLEKQGEQKPVEWSEEDERIYQSIMDDTVQENQLDDRQTKWLSNIKYRYVPQPKQEWSEEDENMVKDIIAAIDTLYYHGMVNWLKSLKDRIPSKQSNKPQGKTALEAIKEEKVDNSNKVEPKFNVGDWVVYKDGGVFLDGRKFAQITKIEGEKHWFDTAITYLKAEDIRLWTIDDAEDGDILYSKKHNLLWRYKNTKECYFCINLNYKSDNISIGDVIVIPNDVRPATKEQRDLVFDKMLQHTFSEINGKKELKKQGEHNSTDNDDKIETKFHEGDWIVVRGDVILICDIRNDLYDVIFADGEHRVYDTNILDKESHLWTIEDAKDGDVLISSVNKPFIYDGYFDENTVGAYCGLYINGDFVIADKERYWSQNVNIRPATKEQCDHLFKVMKEKGYKWCNEKKELKKIGELTPTDNSNKVEPKFHEGDWITNGYIHCKISDVLDDRYIVDTKFTKRSTITFEHEDRWHLWSIYDAQVGDVLISWTNKPFIYNGFFNESVVGAYCGLNTFNRIIITDKQDYLYYNWTIKKDVRPATKEQRDFLFKKIKDKGYEWDNEKKELIRRT